MLAAYCLISVFVFVACSSGGNPEADNFNQQAYNCRYRSLDSTEYYARKAFNMAGGDGDVQAEALNNIAFVSMAHMDYDLAKAQLDSIYKLTDNQIELFIADVGQMRLCQRRSQNKEFYHYRQKAKERKKRIEEEIDVLDPRQHWRLNYANTEYDIVTSTYYYYVGLDEPSRKAISNIDPHGIIVQDTAQWLNYLYNVGAGGIVVGKSQEEVSQVEFDHLMRCFLLAQQTNYPFWVANSLQALSEHLMSPPMRQRLIADNLPAMKFINQDNMPDSLLAGYLAQRSLDLFIDYGDVYQIAGSLRTLGQCFWQIGDDNSALICLNQALNRDTAINQAPDLVASIHEQLSVVYAAINDKQNSDYHRNVYLDMQERTRQDRFLESRAEQLGTSVSRLNIMIIAVIVMIVAIVLLLLLFNYMRRNKHNSETSLQELLQPLQQWRIAKSKENELQKEEIEELGEEIEVAKIKLQDNKKRYVEQRAKISLVESITPLIDRMLHEVRLLQNNNETESIIESRKQYVVELTEQISKYNNLLTEWIQLDKGDINVSIESFSLQSLFDIVARSRASFKLSDVELSIVQTKDVVKADKMLTLFMINTLADNARKFTPKGGNVRISSDSTPDYVEVSIADTGVGMTEKEIKDAFSIERKIEGEHGFGLLNCRGIIEKYRKLSPLFRNAMIGVDSKKGCGSRFFFRLPHGALRVLVLLFSLVHTFCGFSKGYNEDMLQRASVYSDSIYNCNVRGEYDKALFFADSARYYINEQYRFHHSQAKDTMVAVGDISVAIPEIEWLHKDVNMDFDLILDVRNESAVAALALHRWDVYNYNNKVYTQLYKEVSSDRTLGHYVQLMQRSETNMNVAIVILLLLLLSIFPFYYILYYRHILYYRLCVEKVRKINDILLSDIKDKDKIVLIDTQSNNRFPALLQNIIKQISEALKENISNENDRKLQIEYIKDELRRTELEAGRIHVVNNVLSNNLSTIKHETMYYPSRIRQILGGDDADMYSVNEVATYYRTIYLLLCKQAISQLNEVKDKCSSFPLSSVSQNGKIKFVENSVGKVETKNSEDYYLLGDYDMVDYCFNLISKQNGEDSVNATFEQFKDRYIKIEFQMTSLHLSYEEVAGLFYPSSVKNIPYLLCRQIIRDMGELSQARACGITARLSDSGYVIITMILTKSNRIEM